LLGKRDRHRSADPAVAAGDERDPITKLVASFVAFVLGPWLRSHVALESRLTILRLRWTERLSLLRLALVRHVPSLGYPQPSKAMQGPVRHRRNSGRTLLR